MFFNRRREQGATPGGSQSVQAEARMLVLERLISEQHRIIAKLAGRVEQVSDECAFLRECLEISGMLNKPLARTKLSPEPAVPLTSVLEVPELAMAIGYCAGMTSISLLAATGTDYSSAVRVIRRDLAALTPPLWFDPSSCAYSQALPAVPAGRRHVAAASLAGCMMVVGGGNAAGQPLSTLERFDSCSKAWVSLPSMPSCRWSCTAKEVGGHLYVVGGADESWKPLNIVERYEPKSRTWDKLPAMPTARKDCAAVALGGCLYVIGGADSARRPLNCVERFDPVKRTWSSLPPMRTPRRACAAVAVGGTIFVFGGADIAWKPLAAVEKFDPKTCAWVTLPAMPTRRWNCAAASLGGFLYVVGGADDSRSNLSVVERFDPRGGGTWNTLPPMSSDSSSCPASQLRW